MEELLQQLLQRWEQAFDEMDKLAYYKAQITTLQYADGLRYNLETFNPNSFPSEGPMSTNESDIAADELHVYGFNTEGRPCFVTFKHDYNKITWEGYYNYSDTIVEYVEYCLNTGIPSVIKRVKYQDGKKVSYQSIMINGRGSMYSRTPLPKEEIINKLKNDGHVLIYTVTSYLYGPTGRIEKSTSFHNMPGAGKYSSYDEYAYDDQQTLDTIRTFYEEGNNRLAYCRIPENMSTALLIEHVAEAMAQSVSETLIKEKLEQPIAILELSYHYADNYIPLVVYKTNLEVKEQSVSDRFDFINEYHDALQVNILPFERQFAQLEQMMKEKDDMTLGRAMLRKAAYLLTKHKLSAKIKTTDDFAAYAIDWSIEGHSHEHLEEILMECGVEAAVIENWKQRGI